MQLGGYISTYESSTILAKMELIEKARKYATNNGIIEYYEKTGIIKEDYLNYLNTLSKKTRGVGVLHNNTDGSGTWVPLTGTGQPTFGNFNDKASSASGIGLDLWYCSVNKLFRLSRIYVISFYPFRLGFINN